MRWIVGLDLRPLSHGALHFASWLAGASRDDAVQFVVVHVLEVEHLRTVLRYHHLDEVVGAARILATQTLEQEAAGLPVQQVQLPQAPDAVDGLEQVRQGVQGDGFIIGRMAARGSRRIVRLGRVARRLLRHLPAPVIVVPPDLEPGEVGEGPVVVAVGLREESAQTCRFGQELASRLGRPLALVHVVPDPADSAVYGLPDATLERSRAEALERAEADLKRWVTEHDFGVQRTAVVMGELTGCLVDHAQQRRTPLLVVGARPAGAPEPFFATSIGRELAATARVPVAVVPAHA